MNQLRTDRLTGRTVILSPARRTVLNTNAPLTTVFESDTAGGDPTRACPFCPGAESETERTEQATMNPTGEWLVRVVRNRMPIVTEHTDEPSIRGIHEIVIESDRHNDDWIRMTREQAARVLAMYHDRMHALSQHVWVKWVGLYRNRGRRAGSSLVHPHAQLVALAQVPPEATIRDHRARDHFAMHQQSLLCAMRTEAELEEKRVVQRTQHFTVMCPDAPQRNHETWIVPRTQTPHFTALTEEARDELVEVLTRAICRLHTATRGAAYNLVFREPPIASWTQPHAAFYIELLPRMGGEAGFELSTQINVVTVSPETSATEQLNAEARCR